MRMIGENSIEYYYPSGFGESNFVLTNAITGCIDWTVNSVLNYRYDGGDAERPIVEKSLVGSPSSGCNSQRVAVKAVYRDIFDKSLFQILPACPRVGAIKYAYLSGNMPTSLVFDIDTGDFRGCIPEIKDFVHPDVLKNRRYYADGFNIPVGVSFSARAFDSGNTANYIDGRFTLNVMRNWDLERKLIALNTNDSQLNTEFDSGDCICEE